MVTARGAGDTRARLLEAAADLVRDQGAGALTLDAVAAWAGVSKGGLLYHFPSKRHLVRALVEHWMDRFEAGVADADDGDPGGFARAYARVSDLESIPGEERALEFALLAVLVGEPERLDFVRERYRAWQARIEADGVGPAAATLVRLAADGLWFADLLDLGAPRGEVRERVLARMADLTRAGPTPEPT